MSGTLCSMDELSPEFILYVQDRAVATSPDLDALTAAAQNCAISGARNVFITDATGYLVKPFVW